MTCPKCHQPVAGNAPFCASCGSPLPRQAVADPLIGRVLHNKYKVIQLLGEGGMGSVYLGEQTLGTTQRKVAIKTLHSHLSRDESIKERFSREVGTLAALEHPNTVGVYDFGTTEDGLLFIVMEFVQGKPLADLIDNGGALAPDRVLKIVTQIGGSLAEAHSQGIIHRDLKPDNVIITERAGQKDFVKVLDFGIAKRSGEADRNEKKLTQQGMVLGTPPYMSPEQFTGQALDARSDIYSLAIMAYEMLTGKLPFEAASAFEWATLHMTTQPKPIEANPNGGALPDAMRAAVMKALSKAPDQRFASMNEFVDAFTGRMQTNAQAVTPGWSSPELGPATTPDPPGRVRTQMGEPLDFGGGFGAPAGGTAAGPAIQMPPANAYAPPPAPAYAPPPAYSPPAQPHGGGGGGVNKGLILGIAGVVLVGSIVAIAAGTGAFKSSTTAPPFDPGMPTATAPVAETATATAVPTETATAPTAPATTLGGAVTPPPLPNPAPAPPAPKPSPAPAPPAPNPNPAPVPTPVPTPIPTPTPQPPAPPPPVPRPVPTPIPPAPQPPSRAEPQQCQQARDQKARGGSASLIRILENQCRAGGGTP